MRHDSFAKRAKKLTIFCYNFMLSINAKISAYTCFFSSLIVNKQFFFSMQNLFISNQITLFRLNSYNFKIIK